MKFIKTFESIQYDQKVSDIIFDLESIFDAIDLEFDLFNKKPIAASGGIYKNEGFTLAIKFNPSENDEEKLSSKIEECIIESMHQLPLKFSFCLIYFKYKSPITCNKITDIKNTITNIDPRTFDRQWLDEVVIFFDHNE